LGYPLRVLLCYARFPCFQRNANKMCCVKYFRNARIARIELALNYTQASRLCCLRCVMLETGLYISLYKKHLKNVGPIRHCEPPHAACFDFTLRFTRCRYCRTPPAHRCPQRRRQQRQRVTEGIMVVRQSSSLVTGFSPLTLALHAIRAL